MESVKQNENSYTEGGFVAGARTMFGAVCARVGAGEAAGIDTDGSTHSMIGVAPERTTELTYGDYEKGFYVAEEAMPQIIEGPVKVWLLGGETIQSGQFLKKAGTLGVGTEYLGVLGPEADKDVKTVNSLFRVTGNEDAGDIGSADYDQVLVANATGGQKTVTLDATKIAALDIEAGDYVVIDDANGAEVNMVAEVGATTLTLSNPLSNSYATANEAKIYKLTQVKAVFV